MSKVRGSLAMMLVAVFFMGCVTTAPKNQSFSAALTASPKADQASVPANGLSVTPVALQQGSTPRGLVVTEEDLKKAEPVRTKKEKPPLEAAFPLSDTGGCADKQLQKSWGCSPDDLKAILEEYRQEAAIAD